MSLSYMSVETAEFSLYSGHLLSRWQDVKMQKACFFFAKKTYQQTRNSTLFDKEMLGRYHCHNLNQDYEML